MSTAAPGEADSRQSTVVAAQSKDRELARRGAALDDRPDSGNGLGHLVTEEGHSNDYDKGYKSEKHGILDQVLSRLVARVVPQPNCEL